MSNTGDFIGILEDARRSPISVFHNFRLSYYGSRGDDVFLFFEGLDDKLFYIPAILKWREMEEIECFVCDGKKNVLAVRDMVREELGGLERTAFFIDRDFDTFVGAMEDAEGGGLYITDSYSFENLLVGQEAIRALWGLHTPYGRDDGRLVELLASFDRAHATFVRVMRSVTAWCLDLRQRGGDVKLGDARLAELVRFEDRTHLRKLPGGFDSFRESCGVVREQIQPASIKGWIERLRGVEPKLWLRGKFELWFFAEWLKKAWRWLESTRKERGERRRLRCPQLSSQMLIATLSGKVRYTRSLIEFLEHSMGTRHSERVT
jgi:hypothetical protein